MNAWGKTGRVTLGKKRTPSIDTQQDVRVDGVKVGRVFHPQIVVRNAERHAHRQLVAQVAQAVTR